MPVSDEFEVTHETVHDVLGGREFGTKGEYLSLTGFVLRGENNLRGAQHVNS